MSVSGAHSERVVMASETQAKDEAILASLGYKQELKRDFRILEVFGFAFSLLGKCQLFSYTGVTHSPCRLGLVPSIRSELLLAPYNKCLLTCVHRTT